MGADGDRPRVLGVAARRGHRFSKTAAMSVRLVAGLGVLGDGHAGERVQHRIQKRERPGSSNLRQVHLFDNETLLALESRFGAFHCGDLGENVRTQGVGLTALPTGARLRLGVTAVVELTGLRHPCVQLDRFRPGLMRALLNANDDGSLRRQAGVMAIVVIGGDVAPGDPIAILPPPPPHRPLAPV